MSLILKGIDLPKEGTLTFRITRYGKAYEITNDCYYIKGTETEAIQIPKGHGRIKDVSGMINRLEEVIEEEGLDPWCEINAILELIDDQPTILEAET